MPALQRSARSACHWNLSSASTALPVPEPTISRCTDGTILGPDLIFSKINVPTDLVVRAGSSRRPSAFSIEYHRSDAATLIVQRAQWPSVASDRLRKRNTRRAS